MVFFSKSKNFFFQKYNFIFILIFFIGNFLALIKPIKSDLLKPINLPNLKKKTNNKKHKALIATINWVKVNSEESKEKIIHWDKLNYQEYKEFILIDPLDGTKEFIKKNGEFTVNIALIQNKIPMVGIVQLPTSNIQYFSNGKESFKVSKNKKTKLVIKKTKNFTIACSKSHFDEQTSRFLNLLGDKYRIIRKGSSLKFCLIAESKASIYIRFGRTMEWDIAAGHAILRTSGGYVRNLNYNSNEIKYGKKNLQNSSFLAHGKIDNLEKLIILAKQI